MNYAAHAAEAGVEHPTFPPTFTKFPTCLTGPDATVELPSEFVDWEVELVVVIGRLAYEVAVGDGWRHVAGLTVGQDLSERIVQTRPPAPQFSLGKSFPGFGPIGPWVITPDELDDPDDLALGCTVNGEEVQKSRTSDLIFGVDALIHHLSSITPLLPGDLIFTGTPSGVGGTRTPPRSSPPATSSSPPSKASAPSTPTSSRGAPTMTAELEVAYLGVQVADPTAFGTFLAGRRRARPRRHHRRRRDHVAQRRPRPPHHRRGGAGQRRRLRRPRSRVTRRLRREPSSGPAPPARPSPTAPRPTLAARRVEALVRIDTPWGVPFELVHGLAVAPRRRSTRRSCPAASSPRTRASVTWCSSCRTSTAPTASPARCSASSSRTGWRPTSAACR